MEKFTRQGVRNLEDRGEGFSPLRWQDELHPLQVGAGRCWDEGGQEMPLLPQGDGKAR